MRRKMRLSLLDGANRPELPLTQLVLAVPPPDRAEGLVSGGSLLSSLLHSALKLARKIRDPDVRQDFVGGLHAPGLGGDPRASAMHFLAFARPKFFNVQLGKLNLSVDPAIR